MLIKHLELFAGVGGFRQAFELLGKDFNFDVHSVAFSEIDDSATQTYKANFDTSAGIEIGDIVSFVSDEDNVNSLPNFDIVTGGFPCQAFSIMGSQKGFQDLRGNVFFQIINILESKQPQFLLLENVKNLRTHDEGKTFEVIIELLKKAGYNYIFHDIFSSNNFNIAQKRNRLFIFATKTKTKKAMDFSEKKILENFNDIKTNSLLKQKTVLDVLEKTVDDRYYLSDTIKPTILSNGTKGFNSKSEINQTIARPLTATMGKMHRACQDNYYSDEFIQSGNPLEYANEVFTKTELFAHKIRKITPKEAFRLQGFNDNFIENAIEAGVSNAQLYKQAGNAVTVNVVYAILHYLFVTLGIKGV